MLRADAMKLKLALKKKKVHQKKQPTYPAPIQISLYCTPCCSWQGLEILDLEAI